MVQAITSFLRPGDLRLNRVFVTNFHPRCLLTQSLKIIHLRNLGTTVDGRGTMRLI